LSDRDLAKRLSVSAPFIAKMRTEADEAKDQPLPSASFHNAGNQEGVKTFTPEPETLTVVEPETDSVSEPEEAYDERDAIIETLTAENQKLNDRLADQAFAGTEEEKAMLNETIAELRGDVTKLARERDSAFIRAASMQKENAEMKKQLNYWERQVKKLEKVCSDHGIDEKYWNWQSMSR
jgi:predicted RNase H-like nuclease (RuvC/YqgF family)